jgi:hypothetical protein
MSTVNLQTPAGALDQSSRPTLLQGDPITEGGQKGWGDSWGHASLYLVFFSFVVYKAWQVAFEFPPSVRVFVPIIGSLEAKTWSALIYGLGGWLSLSAVVSLSQPGRFVRNLLRPLHAIDDEYIRKVFRNPLAFLLSLVVFIVTILIVTCNVAVLVSSDYEILACLPVGHGSGKLVKDSAIGDDVRLAKGESARLLLRGWGAREVLLIRDRYNLVTLEALEFCRSLLSFELLPLELRVQGKPVQRYNDGMASLEKDALFSLSSRGALSYSNRGVLMTIVESDGVTLHSGRLLVGEPEDGPEDPPNADQSVTLFFKDLWTARDLFATWTTGHQRYIDRQGLVLHHPTQNYNNRILFAEGTLSWAGGTRQAQSKEAIFIISRKSDLPSTEATLAVAMASMNPNPAYVVVGLTPQAIQTKSTH